MIRKRVNAVTGEVTFDEVEPVLPTELEIRQIRDQLLVNSDWTQIPDVPVDQVAWAAYRQELRDITAQVKFPQDVIWPTQP